MLEGIRGLDAAGTPGVTIWLVPLDQEPSIVKALAGTLSGAELRRGSAQQGESSGRRFVVRRAALRALLGSAAGIPPEEVQFKQDPEGKPVVQAPPGVAPHHFSASSAREVAVIAISRAGPVGIDVEWTGGTTPLDRVAERFFSASEQEALRQVPPDRWRTQFFRTWVRKEAFLKGRGDGISARIRTTGLGGEATRDGTAGVEDGWTVRDLDGLPAGYLASLAVEAWRPVLHAPPLAGMAAGNAVQPRH